LFQYGILRVRQETGNTMTDTYRTARDMLSDLAAKKISARELLDAHLARNDALHKKLNAVIETDIPRAMKDAAAIDDARAKGTSLGALAGLPMTIKDGFDVENMPATSGAPGFHGRDRNCADADVVAAARKAGAVIWGKTNVPYMLGDILSYNKIYGTTNNPYDVARTPGGSSGGAATALASGITPLEIGSDIGGSLRHPANFCGVVSLKPTWNVLSLRGHVPPAPGDYSENSDLGVAGPMARNVGDLRLLWNVLRGHEDETTKSVKGARIAVWDKDEAFPLADDVHDAVARVAEVLARQDVAIGNVRPPPGGRELMEPYRQTLAAILGSGLPDDVYNAFAAMRPQDRKTLAEGGDGGAAFRLSSTASFRDVSRAHVQRQKQKDKLQAFFAEGYDAILMPVTPIAAFVHNQQGSFADRIIEVDGKSVPYGALLNWISLATSLHAPALAVQAGQTPGGLPVGVQLVGRWHDEDRLFDLAHAIEREFGFCPPPL
jgi:amidase